MADTWIVTIEIYPYSTGAGAAVDQDAAGPRFSDFTIRCGCVEAAAHIGKLVMEGIKKNPRVWQTHICAIKEQRFALADAYSASNLKDKIEAAP